MTTAIDSLTLLTPRQVAERLGLAVQTLAKWRLEGRGPHFVKLGAAVRYPSDELDDFIAAQPRRRSTSDRPVAPSGADSPKERDR